MCVRREVSTYLYKYGLAATEEVKNEKRNKQKKGVKGVGEGGNSSLSDMYRDRSM